MACICLSNEPEASQETEDWAWGVCRRRWGGGWKQNRDIAYKLQESVGPAPRSTSQSRGHLPQGYFVVPSQDQHTQQLVLFHGLMAILTCDWLLFQMEHLKACAEIAAQRTINWQKFCIKDDCKLSSLGCHCSFLQRPSVENALY